MDTDERQVGEVLRTQLASWRELDAMSRRLAEICDGEPAEILRTLASRETLLKEIGERQEAALAAAGAVDGGAAQREQIETLTSAVRERDERTLGAILTRRDELLAELRTVDRSREAIRAYGPGERDRRRFRDDSA